jgi:16S rRNA processing protein RimM
MTRIALGKIVAAHGLQGEVKILPYGEDPALIETLGPMHTSESGTKALSVHLKGTAGKYILAAVEGTTDRNAAEALRGTELYIDKNSLPPIQDANTYYHADLIGLSVLDENGKPAGRVIDVQNFGGGDFLEIQPEGTESYYLPFSAPHLIEVDIAAGFVKITVPEMI